MSKTLTLKQQWDTILGNKDTGGDWGNLTDDFEYTMQIMSAKLSADKDLMMISFKTLDGKNGKGIGTYVTGFYGLKPDKETESGWDGRDTRAISILADAASVPAMRTKDARELLQHFVDNVSGKTVKGKVREGRPGNDGRKSWLVNGYSLEKINAPLHDLKNLTDSEPVSTSADDIKNDFDFV